MPKSSIHISEDQIFALLYVEFMLVAITSLVDPLSADSDAPALNLLLNTVDQEDQPSDFLLEDCPEVARLFRLALVDQFQRDTGHYQIKDDVVTLVRTILDILPYDPDQHEHLAAALLDYIDTLRHNRIRKSEKNWPAWKLLLAKIKD